MLHRPVLLADLLAVLLAHSLKTLAGASPETPPSRETLPLRCPSAAAGVTRSTSWKSRGWRSSRVLVPAVPPAVVVARRGPTTASISSNSRNIPSRHHTTNNTTKFTTTRGNNTTRSSRIPPSARTATTPGTILGTTLEMILAMIRDTTLATTLGGSNINSRTLLVTVPVVPAPAASLRMVTGRTRTTAMSAVAARMPWDVLTDSRRQVCPDPRIGRHQQAATVLALALVLVLDVSAATLTCSSTASPTATHPRARVCAPRSRCSSSRAAPETIPPTCVVVLYRPKVRANHHMATNRAAAPCRPPSTEARRHRRCAVLREATTYGARHTQRLAPVRAVMAAHHGHGHRSPCLPTPPAPPPLPHTAGTHLSLVH